jgi:hypothetical protein
VFLVRIKQPYQKHGYGKKQQQLGVVFIQDRRLRTDVLFIRAQSTIRADGLSSAQNRSLATTGGAIQSAT